MTTKPLIVHRNRDNVIMVDLGFDVSQDEIASEIRSGKSITSDLIATWAVEFNSDGEDGELILRLSRDDVSEISHTYGYMDLKRITGENEISVFPSPIEVVFQGVVTE